MGDESSLTIVSYTDQVTDEWLLVVFVSLRIILELRY